MNSGKACLTHAMACTLVCMVALTSINAFGQVHPYPSRGVRIVVSTPPGGSADLYGRIIAQKLTEATNQSFIVDNRPGAGGVIAAELVARSAPDGYTLLIAQPTFIFNTFTVARLPYDVNKDFNPITQLLAAPLVLAVHPTFPQRNVRDLVQFMQGSRQRDLTYASGGPGTLPHFAGALFGEITRIPMTHIPYKGTAPSLLALLTGEVQIIFAEPTSVVPHWKAGRLRALAVTSESRIPSLELPTIADGGVQNYDAVNWIGIVAPARTPIEIIDRIHSDVARILRSSDAGDRLTDGHAVPVGSTPRQFRVFLESETKKWGAVARSARVRPE